jgi:hypothetical protein
MPMSEEIANIQNRRQFADFVGRFLQKFMDTPDNWGRNQDIESFLTALEMSTIVVKNVYENMDEPFSEEPSWGLFARILQMASDYE